MERVPVPCATESGSTTGENHAIITSDDACYAYELIKTICAEVGPGLPGSTQERERAAMIQQELESHLGAANVAVEEFTVAPVAYVIAYPLSAFFMLVAALLNITTGHLTGALPWLTTVAALAFSILSPLAFLLLFVLNLEWVDPLLPKKQSVNVIGTLRQPGTENGRRLLILSGHHDSAPANTWFSLLGNVKRLLLRSGHHDRAQEETYLRFLGYMFYLLSMIWALGFITMLVMSIIQLAGVVAGNAALVRIGTLGWVLLACPIGPSIIFSMFFTHGWRSGGVVPGAVDNLSASALAVATCRFLVKNPSYLPADTEIRFISFGSEEAGLRGSRRYVQRHLEELQRLDTRVLNVETVADPEMVILTAEGSGTVTTSPEMVNSLVAAAERAGVPYKVESPWLGAGGDAAPFSQAGIKATTLLPFKMPQHAIAFYHQKSDSPEMLAIEPLLNVLKLTLEWVRCGGQ
jgi:hypothetical protein